ncbi:PP0621 family protein [Pseudoduganella violaceinigra]|uniref:PP0621 family protein n=1 Tax=Pseudoduganella violaceinigra TaxID=246602 RepID=UPI000407427C|nr:PP0621 family protein [Pseudoduganella violaceinigra]
MTRLLFWLALVFLVAAAVRSKLRKMSGPPPGGAAPAPNPPPRAAEQPIERMLQCAHCGVHFPASENVPANGRDYCSPAHAPH